MQPVLPGVLRGSPHSDDVGLQRAPWDDARRTIDPGRVTLPHGTEPWRVAASLALLACGLCVSVWLYRRAARHPSPGETPTAAADVPSRPNRFDRRMIAVYAAAFLGAGAGAKAAFLFAEGWAHRHDWLALLTGRSVLGSLLFGYIMVELAKKLVGLRRSTGDAFALAVPVSLVFGRTGCIVRGCCPGVACERAWWAVQDAAGVWRWPSSLAELTFNVAFAAWAWTAERRGWLTNNRFHLYLIAYGVFRLLHEFARDTARWLTLGDLGFSGYQLLALACVALGAVRWAQRRQPDGTSSTGSHDNDPHR